MHRLNLREADDWLAVRLPAGIPDLLAASEMVSIRPDGSGTWQVRANGWVGATVLGDRDGRRVDLRVTPKITVERLLFLMTYAADPGAWRDDLVSLPEVPDVPAGVAEALARLADHALRQGVVQGYRVVDEAALTVRGRVRWHAQLTRRFGMALPVEVTYDEFSPDIGENQILRAALWRMLSVPGVPPLTRRRLMRLRHRLAGVTDLSGGALPRWQPSRLNQRYQPALRLAELVLHSTSFDLGRGHVPATGFLVSMPVVFEDFVTTALATALTWLAGGRAVPQDASWHLDEGRSVHLRPDLVWYPSASRRDRAPAVVVDAKYKAERFSGFPNPDLYQLLAYCSALGLPDGHLVYAKGNEPTSRFFLPGTGPGGAGVTIHAHALDLDTTPEALLAQVDALARLLVTRAS